MFHGVFNDADSNSNDKFVKGTKMISGRKQISGSISKFSWGCRGKPRKTSG